LKIKEISFRLLLKRNHKKVFDLIFKVYTFAVLLEKRKTRISLGNQQEIENVFDREFNTSRIVNNFPVENEFL
jgi:hypothetical protein